MSYFGRGRGDSLNRTINVSEGLKSSIGRHRLDCRFGSASFPNGIGAIPREMTVDFQIGAEGYPGSAYTDAARLLIDGDEWETKDEYDDG